MRELRPFLVSDRASGDTRSRRHHGRRIRRASQGRPSPRPASAECSAAATRRCRRRCARSGCTHRRACRRPGARARRTPSTGRTHWRAAAAPGQPGANAGAALRQVRFPWMRRPGQAGAAPARQQGRQQPPRRRTSGCSGQPAPSACQASPRPDPPGATGAALVSRRGSSGWRANAGPTAAALSGQSMRGQAGAQAVGDAALSWTRGAPGAAECLTRRQCPQ